MSNRNKNTDLMLNHVMLFLFLHLTLAFSNQEYFGYENSRELLTCPVNNKYPVFYGGVNHDFARYTDVSPDEKYIIMCGESYSYNFVSNWLEGYLLMINANDGTYVWGKYFQDTSSNPTTYMGLINVCKFV